MARQEVKYKKIGKWITRGAIGFVALSAILVISLQLLEPTIGKQAIKKLQEQLKVPSEIQDYHLSLFANFPRLSLVLEGVTIHGLHSTRFIQAGEASLEMNLWDLIDGHYVFKALNLRNTRIQVHINQEGQGNWNIFQSNGDSSTLSMKWNSVYFKNVAIQYYDATSTVKVACLIHSGQLSGKLNGSQIDLYPDLKLNIQEISSADAQYFADIPTHIEGTLFIDTENGFYDFKSLVLNLAQSDIRLSGTINNEAHATYYDLKFNTEKGNLNKIKNILPQGITESFHNYTIQGDAQLKGEYAGVFSRDKQPQFSVRFNASDALLDEPSFTHPLRLKQINGMFTINKYGTTKLLINNCKGLYGDKPFSGNCTVVDFSNPQIDANFSGVLPFQLFQGYFALMEVYGGRINIRDFVIKNLRTDGNTVSYDKLSGEFAADDLRLALNKHKMAIPFIKGELMPDDILIIDSSALLYGHSDVHFKGSVRNFINTLIQPKKQSLAFDLSLQSSQLKLKELYRFYEALSGPQVQETSFKSGEKEPSIFAQATGKFTARVTSLTYGDIRGEAFTGELFLKRNTFLLQGKVLTCGGGISMRGTLDRKNRMRFSGQFNIDELDIHRLFTQWNNFGQTFIQSRNLDGKLSGKTSIKLQWDKDGKFLYDNIDMISSISIEDGILKNFELLEGFSDYIAIEELRNIHFKHLKNILIIRNRNIYIPAMFIQSSAMNLTVNGIHTFDNRIDYNIKLNAGQVLLHRIHDNSAFIPARRNGWFNLYYTITGILPNNYSYHRDKSKVLSSFKQSINMRKRNEAILRKDFPQLKAISEPKTWKNAPVHAIEGSPSYEIIEGF